MGRSGEDAPRGRALWEAVRVSLEAAGKCFLRKKPGPEQSKYCTKDEMFVRLSEVTQGQQRWSPGVRSGTVVDWWKMCLVTSAVLFCSPFDIVSMTVRGISMLVMSTHRSAAIKITETPK